MRPPFVNRRNHLTGLRGRDDPAALHCPRRLEGVCLGFTMRHWRLTKLLTRLRMCQLIPKKIAVAIAGNSTSHTTRKQPHFVCEDYRLNMIPALFFDLDGTLVDSEPLHWLAWRTALRQLKIELSWQRVDAVELTTAEQNAIAAQLYISCDFQEIGTLHIPLGVDPSMSPSDCITIDTWREERHMVYVANEERSNTVRAYLFSKQRQHASYVRHTQS